MRWHISFFLVSLFLSENALAECNELIETTPQGIMCLHCMQPEAKGGVSALTDVLVNSCLKNVAISFLTDGSFGFDESVIRSEVQKLSQNGRRVFLYLNIVNGPGQRRWKLRAFKSFAIMNPLDFRRKIRSDLKLRGEYLSEVRKLIPIIELTVSLGGVVHIAPALEDNLDDKSFREIINLTRRSIPPLLPVTFVRSPCSDCYAGNTTGLPTGVIREQHTTRHDFSLNGGIISNDGHFFTFADGESSAGANSNGTPTYTIKDLDAVRDRAQRQNNSFLIWIGKYQGSDYGRELQPVSKRKFERPNAGEIRDLTQFFKAN